MYRLLAASLLLAFAAACTSEPDEPGADAPADAGLIEPQRQALERARNVEADVAEAAQAQRDALERLESGDESDGDG